MFFSHDGQNNVIDNTAVEKNIFLNYSMMEYIGTPCMVSLMRSHSKSVALCEGNTLAWDGGLLKLHSLMSLFKSNLGKLESYIQSWLDLVDGRLIFLIFIMFASRVLAYLTGLWWLRDTTAIRSLDLLVKIASRSPRGQWVNLSSPSVTDIHTYIWWTSLGGECNCSGPFCWHGLTLIPAWITNHIH